MSFTDYISQQLAVDVQNRLRLLSSSFPNVQSYYDPATGWFRKGTVRAEAYTYLRSYASQNNLGSWLIAARQPLPVDVRNVVASVLLADPADATHVIGIRVTAAMRLDAAISAAAVLADYQESNPGVRLDAYALFTAPDTPTVASWVQQVGVFVQSNYSATVTPIGVAPGCAS